MENSNTAGFLHQETNVFTVSKLNRIVAQLLEESLQTVWVSGEISNFTAASSGHWYFTLKDERAAVKAVMFRMRASQVGFVPRVGEKVEVLAQASFYEPRGDFQLQVQDMRKAGSGNLHEWFLRIKEKLASEGLFAPERKKPLKPWPKAIGVVTSLGAAALRDVLTTLKRRAPHIPVIIYPALVQGNEAAQSLTKALVAAEQDAQCEVLLLVRGGGSIEDLWCFNDEVLARLIAQLNIPIISGVGHETDFTIADFVADLRAATPTAAAELCCTAQEVYLRQIDQMQQGLNRSIRKKLDYCALHIDKLSAGLISPKQKLQIWHSNLHTIEQKMHQTMQKKLSNNTQKLQLNVQKLYYCSPDVLLKKRQLDQLNDRMQALLQQKLLSSKHRLNQAFTQLDALSPRAVLARGYSITYDEFANIVRDPEQLKNAQVLRIELERGYQSVSVIKP